MIENIAGKTKDVAFLAQGCEAVVAFRQRYNTLDSYA